LIRIFTCGRSGKLFDAEAGVEGPDGERGAAFVPEQDEPTDADAVRVQELRPPAPQERALAIPTHLHAPDLAERAHDEGCGLARSVLLAAAAGSGVEGIGKLVGDALQKQRSVGLVRGVLHRAAGGRTCSTARKIGSTYQLVEGRRHQNLELLDPGWGTGVAGRRHGASQHSLLRMLTV
jgi:hypothetical protein